MKLKARATHKAGEETSVASLSLTALVVKEPRGSFWGILPALGRAKGDPIESTSWWGLLEMQRGQKRFRSHPGLYTWRERETDASEKNPGAWHGIRAEMGMQSTQHRGAGCRLELGGMLPAVGEVATLLPS